VKGTVVRYEPRDPHVLIHLEEKTQDGQARQWTMEGPILARLARMKLPKDFLKAGDVIEVCGFAFKKQYLGNPLLPALHAHVLVMPDGTMRPWGPYGKLDNCIRPDDSLQTWVDFVNTNPMAREYWCNRRGVVKASSVATPSFVDEIDGRMAQPCGH
jgi:hypothetical protein